MKRVLYLLVALIMLNACNDDDNDKRFPVNLRADVFRFTPVMGGAVMHYTLSDDPDIVGINVRYNDVYGKGILRTASVTSDSVLLVGFNEAKTGIPAQVSLVKYDKTESEPIDVKFDTKDSAPITFINSVEIFSGWDGFSLSYVNPVGAVGMAHVFYLGTNPVNNEPDTVLINSFPLTEGEDVIIFKPEQKLKSNTIIVRADDYRGYIVKEKVWENIEAYETTLVNPVNFEIIYHNSIEDEVGKLGLKYLTDGDTKGSSWFQDNDINHYYTFLSNTNGAGEDSEPMYIDLKKPRLTSEIRFYAYLSLGQDANYNYRPNWGPNDGGPLLQYWRQRYPNKLPCDVTIYGCKENSDSRDWDSKEWVKIGSFSEEPRAPFKERWNWHCSQCDDYDSKYKHLSLESLKAADPIFKAINFAAIGQGEGFRYLKIKFNQVFGLDSWDLFPLPEVDNERLRYLTFHELEVYSKKD